MKEKLLLKKA